MLYIHMLGYDVDFGHMEAVSLISAPKYPEKQVCKVVCQLKQLHIAFYSQEKRNWWGICLIKSNVQDETKQILVKTTISEI